MNRWIVLSVSMLIIGLSFTACARNRPPIASPAGVAAFEGQRVIKALDLIRDVAIDAESHHLMARNTARTVVQIHKSAVIVVDTAPSGWRATVNASLDELAAGLPASERSLLAPYIALAKLLIQQLPTA